MILFFFFCFVFFFFNDTATTEIYTLSLHDALPIWCRQVRVADRARKFRAATASIPSACQSHHRARDRKSTRLNSSHTVISYAVFCLKKKKNKTNKQTTTHKKESIKHT